MSLIRMNDVSVSFENTPVLREAFFKLESRDRVGLIGRNGSGKSTLLKLVLEQVTPDAGTVALEQGLTLGYFSQFSELDGTASITQVLEGLFANIHRIEEELAEIDAAVAVVASDPSAGSALDALIERQAALFEQMEHQGGWDYQRNIDTALTTLGFDEPHRVCPIDEL